jgi:diguanylate cyclase (GGDEF)-like protein
MTEPKTILIADDDPDALLLMTAALQGAGFSVIEAIDGDDALQQFHAGRFDLVMLDVDMPGMNGYEVCEALRQMSGDLLPIVIVTGMDDLESVDRAYRAGATDFIAKPISWALIGHRVKYLLRGYQIVLDLKAAQERIRRLAYFDTLTGLPNREYFRSRLASTLERAKRHASPFAVFCIDLDNFKRINDTLGHSMGDALLQMVATRLREAIRSHDALGGAAADNIDDENISRLGGDEFMVVLPKLPSPAHASAVAERVIQAVAQPMFLAQHEVLVTPSIGIAVYPSDGSDAETLIRNADLAMYFAKRLGPGTFAFFAATMSTDALQRLTVEGQLRWAIERHELSLLYQPQFDLATGAISSLEALVRWSNPELGNVPPAEFIPIAEQTGLIQSIGEWVLRAACTQAHTWLMEGLPVTRVAVNVSGLQLSHPGFTALVSSVLSESGLAAECLELEVTESVLMQDNCRAVDVLTQLKATGVDIAIDDFGTGHSSFARLSEFPVDRLKIDRAFVQRAHVSQADKLIASAIIGMAKTLGLEVVAEGVEEFAQLMMLQDEHCTLAQGYLLSRPLTAAEAGQLLRRSAESVDATRTERLKRLFT